MEIIKSEIQITLTKTQLLDLIQEALTTEASTLIKRALIPVLQTAFPQFPDFTNISVGETDASGQTIISLRQPASNKIKPPSTTKLESELKSIEPLEIVSSPTIDKDSE